MYRTITLRTKFVGALALIMTLLLVANILWMFIVQRRAMEDELLEESRALGTMMTSVWDFADINKEAINTSSSGEYDYKGLHCSIVGKSVGKLFSQNSDYAFRFVNFSPRNSNASPDDFEAEALKSFLDGTTKEYYAFSTYEGKPVFRYVYSMEVKKSCLECHGEPKGEIDISGYPKEGWQLGANAGAGSIIIPSEKSQQNMIANLAQNGFISLITVFVSVFILYMVLSRLVLAPMSHLQSGFRSVGKGDIEFRLTSPKDTVSSSREMASVFYSFNNMTQELSELYRSLEERVELRTEELSEANRELELQREKLRFVNEQLQRESQYKTDFLAMVSHELRTPLTSILAFAQLLKSTLDDQEKDEEEQLARIINNSHQLLELINNLLDSIRIESGKQIIQKEYVDLYDIVGETIAFISPLAVEKDIDIQVAKINDIPIIESDPDLIYRVLQNLLSNAVKFTPMGGSAEVRLLSNDDSDRVFLVVSDTGIGISEEEQRVIFERFVQANMSMNRTYGGSGLGLALCREILTLLGGSISVESELEKGSTFTVMLPVMSKEDDNAI